MTMLKGYIKSGDSMQAIGSSDIACGTILAYAGNGDIPVGYLLCNGVGVSKTTYPSLFSAIGYTYGGSGDLFNLPDLRDKFIEGATTGGTVKEAGLPNITGAFYGVTASNIGNNNGTYGTGSYNYDVTNGAFSRSDDYSISWNHGQTMTTNAAAVYFDASSCSSIYGNSDTVQPPALTMRYIIKAFNGASPSSTDLEITRVANDLLAVSSGKVSYDDVLTLEEIEASTSLADTDVASASAVQLLNNNINVFIGEGINVLVTSTGTGWQTNVTLPTAPTKVGYGLITWVFRAGTYKVCGCSVSGSALMYYSMSAVTNATIVCYPVYKKS